MKLIDFFKRNIILISIVFAGLIYLGFQDSLLDTLFLIIVVELLAVSLSGLSVYLFTKLDFVETDNFLVLGLIFLGVHICVGLVVLGVYIVQFSY